ncbi:hypothetical protein ACWD3J_13700 [Streptomyces sp. NPDC002755]
MDASSIIALTSSLLAGAVAVVVPWQAFRYALRQEHARLTREQRVALYTDLLVETHAEQQWLTREIAIIEQAPGADLPFTDLRLSSLDRARLGARSAVMGSTEVTRRFNEVQGIVGRIHLAYTLGQLTADVAQMRLRVEGGRAADALEKEVRKELGADISLQKGHSPRT